MRYLPKYVVVLSLAVFFNIANAGGSYFSVQITDIKTISNKEHHIRFELLKDPINEYSNFYQCQSVEWIIHYTEWEDFDNFLLTLKNIITFNYGARQLNKTIEKIKNDKNKQYIISDIMAFQTENFNDCKIVSKTLEITDHIVDGLVMLQPYRQNSLISNKKISTINEK